MRKNIQRIGLIGAFVCCILLLFAACSQNGNTGAAGSAASESDGQSNSFATVEDKQIGVSIEMPNGKDGTLVKAFIEPNDYPADMQPKDGIAIDYFAPSFWEGNSSLSAEDLQRRLLSVQYYDQTAWDGWIAGGKSMSDITGISTNKEIGRKDGMVYICSQQDINDGKLEGRDLELYRSAVQLIPQMRDSIKLISRAAANMSTFPSVSTKDINDKAVDDTVISANKLTMINFWATFCGPCVEEMPDLQKMSAEMPDGTKLIGIVGDAADDQLINQAQKLADSKGVTYPNLIPDAALREYINKNITAYPTTIFVDSKGNIIGDAIVGAHNREFYETELANRLKGLNSLSEDTKSTDGSKSDNSTFEQPQGNDSSKAAGPAPAPAS